MKIAVIAYGVRRVLSGRFKLLLNWSKGLNGTLIVTESKINETELDLLGFPKKYYHAKNIVETLEVVKQIEPDFIFVDDRSLLSINKSYLSDLKRKTKIITYTYPIKGLWALRGLPLKNMESKKEKWKRSMGRLLNGFVLGNYVNKLRMHSDIVVAQSYTASGILRYGYGLEPDIVLYNPVDRNIFNPKVDVETKFYSNYVILYLGSGDGDTALSSLKEICKVLKSNYRIYTFGDKRKLRFIKDCDYEYLESLSDQELATIYSKSKFTIVPQIDEPIGYVSLESISTGTPVLSTYPEEAIINGYNGLYGSDKVFIQILKKFIDETTKSYEAFTKYYNYAVNYSEEFDMNELSQNLLLYLNYVNSK